MPSYGQQYYPQTQMNYAQPAPMPPVPQVTQPQNSILTIFVNSEEEVEFYPVAAGVTVILIAFNLGKFWLKSTGKNGVPEPLRKFNFDEEITASQTQNGAFVSKDEFDALSAKLDKLISSLGGDK